MRTYPRLSIRRRSHSVLVTIGPGHRGYELRRMWTVLWVDSPQATEVTLYAGRDDSVYGWVDCIDYANATINYARTTEGESQ